ETLVSFYKQVVGARIVVMTLFYFVRHRFQHVGVVRPCKTAVCRDYNVSCAFDRPFLEHRVGTGRVTGCNGLYRLLDLIHVRLELLGGLLRALELGVRNHLHRSRNLTHLLSRSDTAVYFLYGSREFTTLIIIQPHYLEGLTSFLKLPIALTTAS